MILKTEYRYLLADISFRFFMTSCFFGTLASGLAYILLIWMVIAQHATLSQTLALMLCFWVPRLLFGAHIGAWVDRTDRRKLMIIAESLRAIKFMLFGIIICWHYDIYLLYFLTLLAGFFGALYIPLLPAFLYDMVDNKQLLRANTLTNSCFEFGSIFGRGALAVITIYFFTPEQALFIVALLYVFSAWTIVPICLKEKKLQHQTKHDSICKDIMNVVNQIKHNSQLRSWGIIQALATFCIMCAPVLIGPYVKNNLHMGLTMFSVCESTMAIATIVGAFFWTFICKTYLHCKYVLMIALSMVFISYIIIGLHSSIHTVLSGFVLLGFSWGCWSLIISHVQQLTPKGLQGRIQAMIGIYMTLVFMVFYFFLLWLPKYSAAQAFFVLAWVVLVALLFVIFQPVYYAENYRYAIAD